MLTLKLRPVGDNSAGQQLVCCAGLSVLGWGRRWRAPAGGSYIVLLLTVVYSYRRREPPPAAHRSQEALPLEDAIPGIFHYPQLSCLSASSRQSLCSTPNTLFSVVAAGRGCAGARRHYGQGSQLLSVSLYLFYRQSRVPSVRRGPRGALDAGWRSGGEALPLCLPAAVPSDDAVA
jgi:hypothetical protein